MRVEGPAPALVARNLRAATGLGFPPHQVPPPPRERALPDGLGPAGRARPPRDQRASVTAADAERRCSCSTTLADGWLRIYLWFEWLSRDPLVSRCWHWHDS